jgi:formamidopyrimidine-DNA glycosylase
MPELPEVEVVRSGLSKFLIGKTISDVNTFHKRVLRNFSATGAQFKNRVINKTILDVRRRGKFLWLVLNDDDWVISAHLGMSGQFLFLPIESNRPAHARARFEFANWDQSLIFSDQRTFGWLNLEPVIFDAHQKPIPASVKKIQPDLFSEEFDVEKTIDKLLTRKTAVKNAILNQELISGVGNIYADEALWQAQLDWKTPANLLTRDQYRELIAALSSVMAQALKAGGTSFDALYVNVNGESGYFEQNLKAYGRAGQFCYRCKSKLIREAFGVGRGSVRCPQCQKRKTVRR